MKHLRIACCLLCLSWSTAVIAQSDPGLEEHCLYLTKLHGEDLDHLLSSWFSASQFVMLGEQHGIQEVGQITNMLFDFGQSYGFKNLCIETDASAARQLDAFARSANPVAEAKAFYQEFPFSIPFYNNVSDYELLSNVINNGGQIWGIDQSFMGQFRYSFAYLADNTQNEAFKKRLLNLRTQAEEAMHQAIELKNYQTYIFQYDEETHRGLLAMASSEEEKEVLHQLWKTKEIYGYFFQQQHYLNNETRGRLMKQNFMRYYDEAAAAGSLPKVLFKLGANHAARGLTRTNIYDISNLVSELAIMNGARSLHLMVMGISGQQYLGNPFAPTPVVDFDNREQFPKEVQELIKEQSQKYFLMNLEALRPKARQYSEALQTLIFKYDLLILVKDAVALDGF